MYDVAKWIVEQFVKANLLELLLPSRSWQKKWSGHGRTGWTADYGRVFNLSIILITMHAVTCIKKLCEY